MVFKPAQDRLGLALLKRSPAKFSAVWVKPPPATKVHDFQDFPPQSSSAELTLHIFCSPYTWFILPLCFKRIYYGKKTTPKNYHSKQQLARPPPPPHVLRRSSRAGLGNERSPCCRSAPRDRGAGDQQNHERGGSSDRHPATAGVL